MKQRNYKKNHNSRNNSFIQAYINLLTYQMFRQLVTLSTGQYEGGIKQINTMFCSKTGTLSIGSTINRSI